MASSREYLDFVLDQLSTLEGVTYRPMMGEFLLYYKGRLFGGVYDDRLLIKPVKAALRFLAESSRELAYELPYEGAKPMLLADIDDREFTADLIRAASREPR